MRSKDYSRKCFITAIGLDGDETNSHQISSLRLGLDLSIFRAPGYLMRDLQGLVSKRSTSSRPRILARSVNKIGKLCKTSIRFANFGGLVLGCIKTKFSKKIIMINMRLTAFFKLYKMCIFLHRCNLKILAKIGLKNQQLL